MQRQKVLGRNYTVLSPQYCTLKSTGANVPIAPMESASVHKLTEVLQLTELSLTHGIKISQCHKN